MGQNNHFILIHASLSPRHVWLKCPLFRQYIFYVLEIPMIMWKSIEINYLTKVFIIYIYIYIANINFKFIYIFINMTKQYKKKFYAFSRIAA